MIKSTYESDPKWNNDNFFIPLMALGDARVSDQVRTALEDRKRKLLEIIETGDEDPLVLADDSSQSLTTIQGRINSNIGRRQRSIVYGAFRRYFRLGTDDSSTRSTGATPH